MKAQISNFKMENHKDIFNSASQAGLTDNVGTVEMKQNRFSIFYNFFAAIGITSGLLLMVTVLILWAVFSYTGTNFHGWDVIMLVTALTALGIGAHFLDKAEVTDKAERIERCREQGMIDE
jgi:uncharacterized membrane protein